MSSTFNMPCVKRNFMFLLTGVGKGIFNIIVGLLLFLNDKTPTDVMGAAMVFSGFSFLFLSKYKNMSDDDLNRAMSLYTEQNKKIAKKAAVNFAHNNKDAIAKAAYDNKDVIAQVAYDNKDVIA